MPPLKASARRMAKEAFCTGLEFASHFNRRLRENDDLEWLFILTMPNSGSTALGKLLMTSDSSVALTDTCEGEWLLPSASNVRNRWNDDYMFSVPRLRARWLNRLAGTTKDGRKLVIEKSPSNMVRIDHIRRAFSPMKNHVAILVRNPYATCESWHRRHGKNELAASSMPKLRQVDDEPGYFKTLGEYWVRRWKYMSKQEDKAVSIIRYEDLVTDPATALSELVEQIPALSDVDFEASLSVKDYGSSKLQNMNEQQISSLSEEQISAISDGLRPHRHEIEKLGYELI